MFECRIFEEFLEGLTKFWWPSTVDNFPETCNINISLRMKENNDWNDMNGLLSFSSLGHVMRNIFDVWVSGLWGVTLTSMSTATTSRLKNIYCTPTGKSIDFTNLRRHHKKFPSYFMRSRRHRYCGTIFFLFVSWMVSLSKIYNQ